MKRIIKKFTSDGLIGILSYPPYLYFSVSVFFSQVAFNMLNIILIFLIFHLTSSNFAVSMLLFAILIPQIFLSFIGGVFADIGNKKKILIFGNLVRAAVLVLLFLNFKSMVLVYFVALVISVITQFYVPAESPLIPALVKKDKLVAANSIFGISLFGSILIGYVLAGPAINAFGRGGAFIALSVIFLLAGIFAMLIPDKKIKESAKEITTPTIKKSIRTEFKDSYSILKKTKQVADAFFLLIFSQIIIFILATIIPGYAKSILQVPAEDLSVILFAPAAIGMIVAAFLMSSVFAKANKKNLINGGIIISGVVLILLPFTSRILSRGIIQWANLFLPYLFNLNIFNFVLLLAFFAGAGNALIFVPSQATIQEIIPSDFRSKIYGLLFALIGVFSLLPILIAGVIADLIGVGAVLFFIGVGILIIGLFREKFFSSVVWALKKR